MRSSSAPAGAAWAAATSRVNSSAAGYILGLRFYKGNGNTGTHVGHLWTTDGTTGFCWAAKGRHAFQCKKATTAFGR